MPEQLQFKAEAKRSDVVGLRQRHPELWRDRTFEAGQNQVIDEGLEEAALFVAASANDPKAAIGLDRYRAHSGDFVFV
jgi:hypothetical protein